MTIDEYVAELLADAKPITDEQAEAAARILFEVAHEASAA